MKILKIKDLTKSFQDNQDRVTVLNHLSFEMEKGEFVSIVGVSGCGKSTLLHLIAGIDQADSGEILVNDQNIFDFNEPELARYRRQDVSLIYQFYNLLPILNTVDNIILPLKLDQQEVDEKLLEDLLDSFQLKDKAKAFPSQLSGGQQQKVAIARAVMACPQMILADEPTGHLDQESADMIIKKILEIHEKRDISIIMVTHNIELAKIADRVLVLENGQLHAYEEK
ncbi:peptide ABC transporter ATP-binding protein [Massilimicrobiota sp. An105]|uniref:ABC transporter ATP-binding protein n=1 Tax=Massilimicrobiota sp. An105 TaxID=1965540 RepID=UPI000B37FA9D|nr:ABC transporter ATP-binding protein [Massilimicrobiota sp. An105]OUQ74275.1 peptide ABC transporter ATP-binding protein [Massilimicrobiota sp. An105]